MAVCDAVIPPQKQELIAEADKQVSQVSKLFNRGLISENERYSQTINIWQATTDKVSKALADNLPKDNEIYMMADSGARGSMNQIKQLAGMRGLLANTAGHTIEMPIRANYRVTVRLEAGVGAVSQHPVEGGGVSLAHCVAEVGLGEANAVHYY